jgi:hypothetical protein
MSIATGFPIRVRLHLEGIAAAVNKRLYNFTGGDPYE